MAGQRAPQPSKSRHGESYRKLATVCKRRHLRLLLRADLDHRRATQLTTLDILKGDELRARVSLREHDLDSAAQVALVALELGGIR